MEDQWVSMREAALKLKAEGYKISPNKISRLASRGEIQVIKNPTDKRTSFVNLDEIRALFVFPPTPTKQYPS